MRASRCTPLLAGSPADTPRKQTLPRRDCHRLPVKQQMERTPTQSQNYQHGKGVCLCCLQRARGFCKGSLRRILAGSIDSIIAKERFHQHASLMSQLSFLNHYQQIITIAFIQFVMFVARKILRKALSLHSLLRYLNSTQENADKAEEAYKPLSLSPEAQRALWANHFIKTIIREPLETTVQKPSLREKLIDSPSPIPQHEFSSDIKKEMTGIFTQGMKYNRIVFDQDRIREAEIERHKLAFYPSALVTTSIFFQLDKSHSRIMFQGTYGIGKTISIVFYIHLSNFINQYALLAARDENKFLKEYKYLVGNKYLPQFPVKYWYWSMNQETFKQSKDIYFQNLLAYQATELTQEERKKIQSCISIQEAQDLIRNFYKIANFQHIAVLDQINHAVSFIRKWNSFLKIHQKKIDSVNKKKNSNKVFQAVLLKEKTQSWQSANLLITLAKKFTAINKFSYVLNSSISIEKHLLEKQKPKDESAKTKQQQKGIKYQYEPLIFQLQQKSIGHNPMEYVQFPFQKHIQTQSGKIRFWHFFLDVLEEKSRIQNYDQQKMKKFKAAFLQYACSLDLKGYNRFLHIRKYFQKHTSLIISTINGMETNEAIKKIVPGLESASLSLFKDQVRRFVEQKGDPEFKRMFLKAIYIYATRQKEQMTDSFEVDLQIIGLMVGQKDFEHKLRPFLLSGQYNKQFIPIKTTEDPKIIVILWSPLEFISISQEIMFPGLKMDQPLLPEFQIEVLKTNPVNRGTTIESLINRMLVKGSKFTFYNAQNVRPPKKGGQLKKVRTNLTYKREEIYISDTKNFISFDSKNIGTSKAKTLEDHFQSVLKQCENNAECWIASLPTFSNLKKDDDVKFNNPSVDFSLAKCTINNNNEKEFIVYTFDTTIAFKTVSQKEKKSKELLLEKLKGVNRKLQIRHHILCLQKRCVAALPVSQNLSIYFSSINRLKISEEAGRSLERKYFEQVRKLIIGLLENKQ